MAGHTGRLRAAPSAFRGRDTAWTKERRAVASAGVEGRDACLMRWSVASGSGPRRTTLAELPDALGATLPLYLPLHSTEAHALGVTPLARRPGRPGSGRDRGSSDLTYCFGQAGVHATMQRLGQRDGPQLGRVPL